MNIYNLARRFHRLTLLFVVLLGIIQMTSGFFLKYTDVGLSLGVDILQTRQLHNNVSTFFSIFLTFQLMSGLILYLYPYIKKIQSRSKKNITPNA